MWQSRPGVLGWLTTTDHKRIGLLYFWTTLVLFAAGGAEALLMRTQLAQPNQHVVGPATYDELFTMHGLTMIFFFIIPMTTGAFGNYLLPLMIGARDMAFPRLNALSYWVFLASGIFVYTSLFLGQAPNAGWFDYVPLASREVRPRARRSTSTASGSSSTGSHRRSRRRTSSSRSSRCARPGCRFNRMPLFCFAFLAASFGLLFALPVADGGRDLSLPRPQRRDALLRRRARRLDAAVAAPVLVLRPPGGLHPDRPRVRDRDGDHPGLHAAAGGRVPLGRDRRAARRLHRLRRVGAPHVRDRDADGDGGLLRCRDGGGGDPDRRSRSSPGA